MKVFKKWILFISFVHNIYPMLQCKTPRNVKLAAKCTSNSISITACLSLESEVFRFSQNNLCLVGI